MSTVTLSAQQLKIEHDKEQIKNTRIEKYIGHIVQQVERLRKMTDAFLKFAKLEKPAIEPHRETWYNTSKLFDGDISNTNRQGVRK